MKRNVPIWLALTLLMLLMVALATIFLVMKTRQDALDQQVVLTDDVATLEQVNGALAVTVTVQNSALTELGAERDTLTIDMAAVQADATRSADAAATVAAEATQAAAQLSEAMTTIAQPTVTPVAPLIEIVQPKEGDSFAVNETITISFVVADPLGITAVSLIFDDDPETTQEFSYPSEPIVTDSAEWQPTEAGSHTIQIQAVNANGIQSDPVVVTIEVQSVNGAAATAVASDATGG